MLFRLIIATFAGWVNQTCKARSTTNYLLEETRVLKEPLKGRRLCLAGNQRLAAKGKALGRRLLAKLTTIVSTETILA